MSLLIWLGCLLLLLVISYLGIPALVKIFWRRRFLAEISGGDSIYLTFDDGPDPKITPHILNILKEHGVKATFFVTGKMIEQFPEIINRIRSEGHGLGGHSYAHLHPWTTGPFSSYNDMVKGETALRPYLAPEEKILFRPPYGKINMISMGYIIVHRYKVIFWDTDPKDFKATSADCIIQKALDRVEEGGRVILLHDGGADDNWAKKLKITGEAVRQLLSLINDKSNWNCFR